LEDPQVKAAIDRIPQQKAIAAIIGQGIADNFTQEGPGWAPLKASTIRGSVAKAMRQQLKGWTNEELLKHESLARKKGVSGDGALPFRKILQKTRLLYRTATVPDFTGSSKSGKGKNAKTVSGGNIYRVEGYNIIWGTNLSYAKKMNEGDPEHKVPARKFLYLQEKWNKRIENFIVGDIAQILHDALVRGGAL
jgi:phage gpG-like protein